MDVDREEELIGGGCGGFHVAPGVDGGVVHPHLVMDVGPGGAAADSRVADDLATLDAGTGDHSV